MEVVLMGLRGSGKSTVARALSAASGEAFVDLDERTASMLGGATVAEAWGAAGEPAFRGMEVRALQGVLAEGIPIIALGGGTPTAPGAAEILIGLKRPRPPRLVYLRASASILAARLKQEPSRPSLTGADPIEEVPVVLSRRDPLYLQLADTVVEVGGLGVDEVARSLLAVLR